MDCSHFACPLLNHLKLKLKSNLNLFTLEININFLFIKMKWIKLKNCSTNQYENCYNTVRDRIDGVWALSSITPKQRSLFCIHILYSINRTIKKMCKMNYVMFHETSCNYSWFFSHRPFYSLKLQKRYDTFLRNKTGVGNLKLYILSRNYFS